MACDLPDDLDCRLAAGTSRALAGQAAAERLGRLASVYRVCAPVAATLTLEPDAHGRTTLSGTLMATLEGRCQRCLEPLRFEVKAELATVVLADERERRVQDDDWTLAPGGRLALLELIEDELLLACPMIEAHDEQHCRAETARALADDRQRPFAGLAGLMHKA